MKTMTLGTSHLVSTRLAYGCWRLAGTMDPGAVKPASEKRGIQAVLAAYEAGYTLFDHADIYCQGVAESLFGRALKEAPGMRERILVATKCGIRFAGEPAKGAPFRYDFSADHILRSCEGSLKRMGIEVIDLYQLHRPDWLMQPEEVAEAFGCLRRSGKVREFGVSNFLPSQVDALQSACAFPLVVNQVEISLARLDCFQDGTLDQCLERRMTPLAWSPLAGGVLGTGCKVDAKHPKRSGLNALVKAMDQVAKARGTSRTVVALAWLMKHPSGILPIIGTTDPQRIREAVTADDIELSREEWYQLLEAARGERLP
jgi:predicted oxidoreductase